ncbi:hypothetical protein D3Y57_14255 [Sphingomonas paeninsulae]|uniref:Uncharacterized protein n=1 Tax=Sphingomonas paeninsulae TaxID=2319844 RepID=A0A494TCJ1_SPHPE|nr:hypothetical protein [Sphingomonas paeninsulae]AYJ86890.1 hypothetical protein D3Y57_14255 [Sphingomonas paeninsulae]
MSDEQQDHRVAAMAIITSGAALRPKEGQFLGGIAFDANPLTEKQSNWLSILLARHGFDELNGGTA